MVKWRESGSGSNYRNGDFKSNLLKIFEPDNWPLMSTCFGIEWFEEITALFILRREPSSFGTRHPWCRLVIHQPHVLSNYLQIQQT